MLTTSMPAITLLPLAITAGLIALVLLGPRVRSSPLGARLAVEMAASTLVLFALLYALMVAAQHLPW